MAGTRFLWWMSDDGSVLPGDIDLACSQIPTLSQAEEEERQRLHEELIQRVRTGDLWEDPDDGP